MDKKVNGLFSIVAIFLFIISGALMINQWQNAPTLFGNSDRDYALALGALMVINGALFFLDTLCICKLHFL